MQYSTARTAARTRENWHTVSAMREHLRYVGTRIITLLLTQLGYSERIRVPVYLVDSNNNGSNNNSNSNGGTSRSSARTEPREPQQMSRQESVVWGSDGLTPRTAARRTERRRKKRACDHNEKTFCSKCHTRRRHVYRWYGRPYKLN